MTEADYGEPWHMEAASGAVGPGIHDWWFATSKNYPVGNVEGIDDCDEFSVAEAKRYADRIVACVNALAGMDPAAVRAVIEAARKLRQRLRTTRAASFTQLRKSRSRWRGSTHECDMLLALPRPRENASSNLRSVLRTTRPGLKGRRGAAHGHYQSVAGCGRRVPCLRGRRAVAA